MTSLHLTLCVGQGVSDFQLFRDSLHRRISREMRAELSCHFVYDQGSGVISSGLGGNAAELEELDTFIREVLLTSSSQIRKIRLTGYSSIEGGYHTNAQLARDRVQGFYQYLRDTYPQLYRYPYDMAWVAEDWKGLAILVRESNLNERDEILEIIRKVPDFDERERLLVYLNGGRPYAYMKRTMLPQLRRVEIEVEYNSVDSGTLPPASPQPSPKEREPEVTTDYVHQSIEEVIKPTTSPYGYSSFEKEGGKVPLPGLAAHGSSSLSLGEGRGEAAKFALKTNLLLWAGFQHNFKHTTPVANVALEYYISNHYSIELGAMYSYWRYNSNQKFQGISGYRLEPRYRFVFPNDRFGAYLGIYGRIGDYDIRKNNNTTNYTGDYWDAGLSAGLNIKLVGQLGLEVGARVGYVKTRPIKYTMDNQYNWFDGQYKYYQFKVTDLNVSLIYRFR